MLFILYVNSFVQRAIPSVFAFGLFVCGVAITTANAQSYPSTQYNGFGPFQTGGGEFAISQPIPDINSAVGVGDNTSMSPDSWSQPSDGPISNYSPSFSPTSSTSTSPIDSSAPLNEYDFDEVNTPAVPDLKPTSRQNTGSPFLPTGFSRTPNTLNGQQSILENSSTMPSATRYPLNEGMDTTSSAQVEVIPNQEFPGQRNNVAPSSSAIYSRSPNSRFSAPNGVAYGMVDTTVVDSQSGTEMPIQPQPGFGWGNASNATPGFRPEVGFRNATPTVRNYGAYDSGKKYDFEDKKKEFPPFSEILATGRYFGSASMLYLRPSFQGNTAITSQGPGFGESTTFDFDFEVAPQFRFGFESKYGPGLELNYWQYDETSNDATFVSNGVVSGTTSTWMLGPSAWTRLSATNAGDTIVTNHSIDVESFGASFFKEVKLPISRINGIFGFQYVSVAQAMNASLSNAGIELGTLNSRSDMRAFGPKLGFEYYRPVGHTKLEFITAIGMGVLFGRRDQFVENTVAGDFSRVGADEFITNFDFMTGVQYKKMIAENRAYFARAGFTYQTWIGGGTAVNPQDDFGLSGFSISVGYNR